MSYYVKIVFVIKDALSLLIFITIAITITFSGQELLKKIELPKAGRLLVAEWLEVQPLLSKNPLKIWIIIKKIIMLVEWLVKINNHYIYDTYLGHVFYLASIGDPSDRDITTITKIVKKVRNFIIGLFWIIKCSRLIRFGPVNTSCIVI